MIAQEQQNDTAANTALERHYTIYEIAEKWNLGSTKVREMFIDEPGVLKTQLRAPGSRKRQNLSLRIPESVVLRVHARWTGGA